MGGGGGILPSQGSSQGAGAFFEVLPWKQQIKQHTQSQKVEIHFSLTFLLLSIIVLRTSECFINC